MSYIDPYITGIIQNTDMDPEIPENMPLIQMYALLAKVVGDWTTQEDVHDAWALWQSALTPEHKSIIPFEDLTREVQDYDGPYVKAIHKVAKEANKMVIKYDSNNSGGDWWLTTQDWKNLEDNGWDVAWRDKTFLGAWATEASKGFNNIEDAIEDFQSITGEDADDEGCPCCGPPHQFYIKGEY